MLNNPTFLDALTTLIATPSVSSTNPKYDQSNRAVIDTLATWFESLGFSVVVQPLPGDTDKANMIATLGTGPGGLVLSGHTDTVPFDSKGWQTDPFILSERNDRFYGLGSCDMKGFFAVVMEALKPFLGKSLTSPLIVVATADEESSMAGAQQLVAQDALRARHAVIGEPTGMVPITRHKSIAMQKITVYGRSGHSSDPSLGLNAMEVMHDVVSELLNYRGELQAKYNDPTFRIAVPTMNLGCIHGGDNPNRICAGCELHFDARLLPGMTNAQMEADVLAITKRIGERHGCLIELSALINGIEPFYQPENTALVDAACELTGTKPQSVSFATEAPFFKELGIDTVVMGPGSIDQAHQPDEYLAVDAINPAVNVLSGLIKRFCLA